MLFRCPRHWVQRPGSLPRRMLTSLCWGGAKISRPNGQSPAPELLPPLPATLSHQFEISNSSAINKIVLPPPSDSPSAMLLWARKSASPSGSDRLAHPGRDVSPPPWPPSVSRSTDRVTQNNGIDPKPFLAAPRDTKGAAPHQAAPGAPLAGRPGVGNCLPHIGLSATTARFSSSPDSVEPCPSETHSAKPGSRSSRPQDRPLEEK